MIRKIFERLALLLFGLIMALGLLEVGLRVANREFRLMNFWAVNRDLWRSAYPAQFDRKLGWIPRPGTSGSKNVWGTQVTILDDGIRSNGAGSATADSSRLILAVGDSFTFGDEVSDADTWPAQLEELTGIRTLNAGVFGYGLDQSAIRMTQLVMHYRPSAVVLSFIIDDCRRCNLVERTGVAKPYFELVQNRLVLHDEHIAEHLHGDDPLRHALGYSFLVHVLMARFFPEYWFQGASSNKLGPTPGGPITCALFGGFGSFLDTAPGMKFYLLAQYEKKTEPGEMDAMKEFLACVTDPRVEVVDLRDTLAAVQSRDPQAFERLYRNHMTPEGNRLVAQVLATRMAGAAGRAPNASPGPRAVR